MYIPSERQSDGNHETGIEETGITEESPALGADAHILIAYFTAAENSDVDPVASASVVIMDGEAKESKKSDIRTILLRVIAAVTAAYGVYAFFCTTGGRLYASSVAFCLL